RLLRRLRVAGDAALLQDRLDVTDIFDALDSSVEGQARFLARVPLFPRLVPGLRGQQRRLLGQVPDRVVLPACRGVFARRWFLAVGVAAPAVSADLPRTQLVPGLGHVEHHALLIQRLEREGRVGGDLRQEAGVRVAVGVRRLLIALELA